MPFHVEGERVELEGHCLIDEAPPLLEAIRRLDRPVIDLTRADFVHTAVAQVLLVSGGALTQRPNDRALDACLAALPLA